jgi:predicted acyltransferase
VKPSDKTNPAAGRLFSLDLFRGFVMILLTAEGTHLYEAIADTVPPDSASGRLVDQFFHHPWNGLRFWDLVQPYFMFIVGVAMAFSLEKRWKAGDSWFGTLQHILFRSAVLFLLGTGLHCVYQGRLVFEFWNVLTQLSFTILVAFLLYRFPFTLQFGVSVALLLLTELAYRLWPVPGFDQAFVQGHNFGAWMDTVLMGKINAGGWVAVNCVPTAAHTIWGVLAGKLLMSGKRNTTKIRSLAVAGLAGLVAGYAMDWLSITPIIKRICTSSFVIVSGGWALLTLMAFYWLADVRGWRRGILSFTVVGMNSIFIYLFGQTVGPQWFNRCVGIFTNGFMDRIGIPEQAMHVLTALTVLALEWGLCFWLYKRKILIKI